MNRDILVKKLDALFELDSIWNGIQDPTWRWIERIYATTNFDWNSFFEPQYVKGLNGLMLKGSYEVKAAHCSCFFSPEVLKSILARNERNGFIFAHHHFDMETGGRGFLAIDPEILVEIKRRDYSLYYAHAPADCSMNIGTNAAILQAFGLKHMETFGKYGVGHAGRIAEFDGPISGEILISRCQNIFGVNPKIWNFDMNRKFRRVAIVAGGGDDVDLFKDAETAKAELYLTGEVTSRTNGDWARQNNDSIEKYLKASRMSFIALSHNASEVLFLENQMKQWFCDLGLNAEVLRDSDVWR